jgi:NodT family efflux transporter outer membrane factor (OMF) lipoprotein
MWLRFKTFLGLSPGPGRLSPVMIAGMLLLLSGCTVGPNYVRPPTAAPEAYKETPGWKVAQPRDELPRGAWWEIYNDPKLNALEEQVDINNQNIAVAEAQFRQARALVQIARAAYFPTVTGGASWTRSQSSGTIISSSGGGSGTAGTSGMGAGKASPGPPAISDFLLTSDLTWEPDLWGKVRRQVESSRASAQASAADLEGVRLSARATLAQSYFQLRTVDDQKRLLNDTVADYQKILVFTKNQYAQGVASQGDVAIAEAQLKSTQAQAIDLGVQRAQLEHAIALLLGKSPSVFTIPVVRQTMRVPAVPFGVPSELLERRPDIAAAERNMAAANAQIGVALAAYYPTITLSASGGFETSSLAKWLTWPSRLWSLGAAASETLIDFGLRGAQTESARAAYEASVATYRQTVLTGFQQVEDNLAALGILKEESQVQDEAVRASRQSLAVSTNQYKAGTLNRIALLVVETLALANERTAITILGSRMSANVLLIEALGGGWKSSDLPPVGQGPPTGPPGEGRLAATNPPRLPD